MAKNPQNTGEQFSVQFRNALTAGRGIFRLVSVMHTLLALALGFGAEEIFATATTGGRPDRSLSSKDSPFK